MIMRSRYDGEQQSAIFTQPGKWGVVKWLTIHVESECTDRLCVCVLVSSFTSLILSIHVCLYDMTDSNMYVRY